MEGAALGWFESLAYHIRAGGDISPGAVSPERSAYEQVVLEPRLIAALRKINPALPEEAIEHVGRLVTRPPSATLTQNNRWFHRMLMDGIDVEYRGSDGEVRGGRAWLADFAAPKRNDWLVAHQLTVTAARTTRRPDLVVFLNGLPLAVIELKDPSHEKADLWHAYTQLQEYKEAIPSLFMYNEMLVASDGLLTRVGSLTAGPDRFAPWRWTKDSQHPGGSPLEALIQELFEPNKLLDYIRHCVTFEEDERTGTVVKRSAGYHQFRAVQAARDSIKAALRPAGDGRGGVIWHTQGSGKSLTMLMLTAALVDDAELANPTIVVVTDRNDLDSQLFATFAAGRALLRQPPEQAETRDDLATRLNRASGGVVFTTIQKFQEHGGPITRRPNVVVLADEAHRSQYGFVEGGARWMREAVPNATFVAFTGTPLERDDRSTRAVFGRYTDVYDVRQAIEDGATVPIYYEMRLVKLLPDEKGVAEAERRLGAAVEADREGQADRNDIEIPLAQLVGSHERLEVVAKEIVNHFEKRREAIEGKAMVVCMTRNICIDVYDQIVALRPRWHSEDDDAGCVKVVMTGDTREGPRLAQHARSKARREVLARRFKDPEDELRLVIVCDMWLTGFDCPPLHTMYLDKPLASHNLMQAIARVNRVFGEKPGGVIVDFIGIADELRDAVNTYTQAGGEGEPVMSVQREAVPVMLREFEALRDFFGGFSYSDFTRLGETEQLRAVVAGTDYVLEREDGKQRFMNMVAGLSKAFAICVPLEETEAIRDSLAFFQSVRAAIRKRLTDTAAAPLPDSRAAVRQVISGAIASDGVIDLFRAAGIKEPNVGILSDDFLDGLASLPHKHLALETLRQLLNSEIRSRERVNIVQARSFRKTLEVALARYANRAIGTTQVIDELVALARDVRKASERAEQSGLTEEEAAFYDALADNSSAREVLQDDTLRLIARELADRIRTKASLDWTMRETVRADMRRTVRRLLAKYGYPPDRQDDATQLILRQAELQAESAMTPHR